MRLPNGDQAIVDLDKLSRYCQSPNHPRGRHKARVFEAELDIKQSDAEKLRAALLSAAATGDAALTQEDEHGQRFMLEFEMEGPRGVARIRSLWIIRRGDHLPRLTSCYVQ